MKDLRDEELVERFKQGDVHAFEVLYERHYSYLYYVAYKLTHNQEDAKDAVQLSFVQMYESIQSLQNPKYFRLWMNKIVHGKCYNLFRKNRDMFVNTEDGEWTNRYQETKVDYLPEEQLKFTSDQDILHMLIQKLPYSSQEILELHYFSQFKIDEIAQILDVPVGTVKSRLHAAKKSLRKELKNYEEQNHYKLTFHLPGISSLMLLLAYRKEFYQSIGKKTILTSLSFPVVMTTSAALLFAPLAIHAGWQSLQEEQNPVVQHEQSVIPVVSNKDSAQYAYFRLKQIAYDKSQMTNRDDALIQEAMHCYDVLKQTKGPYWELLEKEGYTINFKKNEK